MGLPGEPDLPSNLSQRAQTFLASIAETRTIPHHVLLTVLSVLLDGFEKIHGLHSEADSSGDAETWGIIWNDVKPDHLFWDPDQSSLSLIDWGNAQFLDADRTTKDRQYSWADDYRQLFEEMHRFLTLTASELPARIAWPEHLTTQNATHAALLELSERLDAALQEEADGLSAARQREEELLQSSDAEADVLLERLSEVHAQIGRYGEVPDYPGAIRFATAHAARLVASDRLDELGSLCAWASRLPAADADFWQLVSRLALIPGRCEGEQRSGFLGAIQSAICQDWENVLWNLLSAIRDYPEPEWWPDLCYLLRKQKLNSEAEAVRPFVASSRLLLALQAFTRRLQDREDRGLPGDGSDHLSRVHTLARRLREDIVANWTQIDPDPPHAALSYADVDAMMADFDGYLPSEVETLSRVLIQPRRQVSLILDAWERKDFLSASNGLRQLLVLDPDRRRVLRAENAICGAAGWLNRTHVGPRPGENLQDFVTHLEFEGREIRNQVGPASWLDLILESFKSLRKGAWPADILRDFPGSIREFPWLANYERVERVPLYPEPDQPDAPAVITEQAVALRGVHTGELGPVSDLGLFEPLDAWVPEARGSSARVLLGLLQQPYGKPEEIAIKLMRMDKIGYALPLFREEARILSLMQDVPGVVGMRECGFIQLAEGSQLPLEPGAADPPFGTLRRFGIDAVDQYEEELEPRIREGWVPYLAIEKKRHEDNLLVLCDAGLTRGRFPPAIHLLQMAIQICDILQIAHNRNIVYRDHKILHYYWQAEKKGVFLIDWNVARYHPEGLPAVEVQMDLVQFAARGLHHVLTGRAAPGALPLGPTRPEEIEQADRSYHTQWTYDDQRLPEELRAVLESALNGDYLTADALRADLKKTYVLLPDNRL